MAKKVILGSDFGRDAFKAKVNENFTELYDNSVYQQGQIEDKLSTSHNTDANAHDDIRESINDLEAKVTWKPLDYKTESAKPSEYPQQQTTMFVATQAWQGVSNIVIRTEKYNNNIAIQYLEPNGSLTTPILYRLSIPDTDTWMAWKQIATISNINDLAGIGRTTETVKKNADDILNKMPISTSTVGAVGEFKKIQGADGASLALPAGGTWECQAYWLQTSTGYAAFLGGGAGGIAAGGTQILSAQTGYSPIAFVRRIL